mgnify:CR=1 FL=1
MRYKSARHLSLVRFRHSAAHHAPDRQFTSWSEHRFHARAIDGLEFWQYPRFTDFHAFVVYNNLRQRKNSVELSVISFVFLAQEGLISSFTLRDKWPISCPFIFGLKMAKAKRSSASKSNNFWEVVRNIKIVTQKSEIHRYFALFFRKFWPKTDKKTVKKPTKNRQCVGSWNFACRFL